MKAILYAMRRAPSRVSPIPARPSGCAGVLAALLILAVMPAGAQGVFLDKGQSGKGAEVLVLMKGGEFQSTGVCAGYSLEGFLDLGLDLRAAVATAASGNALRMQAAIAVALPVLKQDAQIPLSLVLRGSFAKTSFMADALDEATLVKQGTGFTVGLDVLHAVALSPQWAMRIGATGTYQSFTDITSASADDVSGYPLVEASSNLLAGLLVGATFQPTKAFLVAFTVRVSMDRTLASVWWEPSLSISVPDL